MTTKAEVRKHMRDELTLRGNDYMLAGEVCRTFLAEEAIRAFELLGRAVWVFNLAVEVAEEYERETSEYS